MRAEQNRWLPISRKEVQEYGWSALDVILVSGDAYIDHPAFGTAVIGRLLESMGLRVAILPQPNWQDDLRDFQKLGAPRLFFGVTSGCMDSMVNHYTANRRKRSNDAYTPGGQTGFRPDYAVVTYSRILKSLFPDVPVVLGGIEASLRRVTHYDYWSDSLKPSILVDSQADLLAYGMGEGTIRSLVKLLQKGVPFQNLNTIPQSAFLQDMDADIPRNKQWQTIELASHAQCLENKLSFARNFKIIEQESNRMDADRLIQQNGRQRLIINPPWPPMSTAEIDASFDLPYTRLPHPRYAKRGPIPAFEMIKASVNMHRGCFGGCSFCTISAHQGKFIASRSKESILKEIDLITRQDWFRGTISDLGGPSANMYGMQGKDEAMCRSCKAPSCIHPVICHNLDTSHASMLAVYRAVRNHPSVKQAYVSSGLRYDLCLTQSSSTGKIRNQDPSHDEYIAELVRYHVPGRLKVAPEHTDPAVLKLMRKPGFDLFRRFKQRFDELNAKYNLKQQLIPYFISSHPGSHTRAMADLAIQTKDQGFQLEQVQDFTPTPMTVATVIYYSGYHPYTLKAVATAKSRAEKLEQRQFFFWYLRQYRQKIQASLAAAGLSNWIPLLTGSTAKPDDPGAKPKGHQSRKIKGSAQRHGQRSARGKKQAAPNHRGGST
ncbi:MAG: YgiQ family radical SAM protein [Leptospiraceae bacterium]|nr:YgiQ family radical SAM protein [Leptospiraceae bacterium]